MIEFRPDRVIDAAINKKKGPQHKDAVFCSCRPVLMWDEDRELLVISHQDFEES